MWTVLVFFLGLQKTLFSRSEVVGIEIKVLPLRCDIKDTDEKLAYIDKLCLENPELIADKIEDEFSEFGYSDGDD